MENDQTLLEIKNILKKHKGKANQISAGKIAEMLNLKQEDTHIAPRTLILEAIKKFNVPVAGSSKGYYLITDKEELEEYMHSIDGRIKKMKERKSTVKKAFEKYYDK
jgi:hypothetical protein